MEYHKVTVWTAKLVATLALMSFLVLDALRDSTLKTFIVIDVNMDAELAQASLSALKLILDFSLRTMDMSLGVIKAAQLVMLI